MQIGVGLPNMIPGAQSDLLLEWARRADVGPFSSLGTLDRLVYPGFEPLAVLAAAAAVTRRIRLLTSVLIAPVRNATILAKQAASVDALSSGRLTLGLGVGGRADDFRAAEVPFGNRGRRFEEQLGRMRQVWSGRPLADDVGPVGPAPVQPAGPEVLVGANSPAAVRRAGRLADGYLASRDPATARQFYDVAESAWKAAGRPGRPRFVGGLYFALGPNAVDRAGTFIRDYYGFRGPAVEEMVRALPVTPDVIKSLFRAYADVGMDELVFWPAIADLDQVDRLAELVG